MAIQSVKHRLAIIFTVFILETVIVVSPVQAESGTEPPSPTISFVQEGELVFGPPLPSMLDFAISIQNMDNSNADLKIQLISLTNEKGNVLPATSIQAIPCENKEEKEQNNTQSQIITRRICLNPASLEWGSYAALLEASLGNLAQTTKSIKLIAGPEIPVAILSSEITTLGTACPKIARTVALKTILCPKFGNFDANLVKDTNLITIAGYSQKDSDKFRKLIKNASGTLVSADGAGRILVRLDEKASFNVCPAKTDRMICGETRLAFSGSTNAGTYTGTLYLDPENPANDKTKVQVTLKTKDYWLLPSLIILLGLLASAWVTWQLGPRKDNKEQERTKAMIIRKRNELKHRLDQFREEIMKLEQSLAYFVEDPDVLAEVEFLLRSSESVAKKNEPIDILTHIEYQDLAQRMIVIVPLFIRLRFFYLALFKLHVWEHGLPDKTPGKNDLTKRMEEARQKLWTADSEAKMDEAQDNLIQAFMLAHNIYWANKSKRIQAPPKFNWEVQPITSEKTESLPLLRHVRNWFVDFVKAVPRFLATLINIPNLLRWTIVLLSGIYVVYATNPTFGTPQDYIYAFLWGSATNAGIEFVTKFFGSNTSIMSVINGLTK